MSALEKFANLMEKKVKKEIPGVNLGTGAGNRAAATQDAFMDMTQDAAMQTEKGYKSLAQSIGYENPGITKPKKTVVKSQPEPTPSSTPVRQSEVSARAERFRRAFGTPTGADPFTGAPTYRPPTALTNLPSSRSGSTPDPEAYEKVKPGDLELKRQARTAEVPGKPGVRSATPQGVQNFLLNRETRGMSNRSIPAEQGVAAQQRVAALMKDPKVVADVSTRINQEVGGRRATVSNRTTTPAAVKPALTATTISVPVKPKPAAVKPPKPAAVQPPKPAVTVTQKPLASSVSLSLTRTPAPAVVRGAALSVTNPKPPDLGKIVTDVLKTEREAKKAEKAATVAKTSRALSRIGTLGAVVSSGIEGKTEFDKARSGGASFNRALGAGAVKSLGGLTGAAFGAAAGGAVAGLPGAFLGGTVGYTQGGNLASSAYRQITGDPLKKLTTKDVLTNVRKAVPQEIRAQVPAGARKVFRDFVTQAGRTYGNYRRSQEAQK